MLSARLVSRATTRSFVRFYTEGATGAPRPAGSADSFNKREKAQEDLYVRQLEKERIAALRKSLKEQRDHLDKIEDQIDQLSK
ncbi:hypothetical protein DV451_003784 [Geotrichum candidum]|uniref:ATPase inhibitor, mitochondrial n=1 Tax=Geotrichum candidum TaxID=1173061 RepID=A0A0J9XAG7_GEOCN|nr:hypothetical protein DV451_003784 [Geotrichum candidum]KAF5105753.1 hypothetical protein DV453_004528 [Geotrichum candidum]KAF5108649.1 hypothetical protein DV452_004787 [Geotrichum candidum]KAF5108651.1 hypothetical protein DV452_004789 [Geotrichum candidum]KAF5112700.1 hypothetical protein DV454_004050 [Geotrichum candidum]